MFPPLPPLLLLNLSRQSFPNVVFTNVPNLPPPINGTFKSHRKCHHFLTISVDRLNTNITLSESDHLLYDMPSCGTPGHIISDVTWGPWEFGVFQQSEQFTQLTQWEVIQVEVRHPCLSSFNTQPPWGHLYCFCSWLDGWAPCMPLLALERFHQLTLLCSLPLIGLCKMVFPRHHTFQENNPTWRPLSGAHCLAVKLFLWPHQGTSTAFPGQPSTHSHVPQPTGQRRFFFFLAAVGFFPTLTNGVLHFSETLAVADPNADEVRCGLVIMPVVSPLSSAAEDVFQGSLPLPVGIQVSSTGCRGWMDLATCHKLPGSEILCDGPRPSRPQPMRSCAPPLVPTLKVPIHNNVMSRHFTHSKNRSQGKTHTE